MASNEYRPTFTAPNSDLDSVVRDHAGAKPKVQYVDLPPGITNGIARLQRAYFSKIENGDNKGAVFFRASATVHEPTEVVHKGQKVPVYGLMTSIMITITPRKDRQGNVIPAKEAVRDIMDALTRLGVNTTGCKSMAEIEKKAQALNQRQPFFRFSTTQSKPTKEYPNPKVRHVWHDACSAPTSAANGPAAGVVDRTASRSSSPGGGGTLTAAHEEESGLEMTSHDEDYTPDGLSVNGSPTTVEDENLDDLASQATAGDTEAQGKLEAVGMSLGLTQKQVEDDFDDWVSLVEEIRRRQQEGQAGGDEGGDEGDGDEPEVASFEPEVGEPARLKLLDPDGTPQRDKKGKLRAPVPCKVLKVNRRKKMVDLVTLDGREEMVTGVPWTSLVAPE